MQPKKSLDLVFHLPKVSALRMSPTMFAGSQAMFPKRSSNVPRRSGNAPRKPDNDLGKPQNVPGRSGNVLEGPSNVPGRSGKVRQCFWEVKHCSWKVRQCSREVRQCSREVRQCSREVRQCSQEAKQCSREVRQCSREARQYSWEARQCSGKPGNVLGRSGNVPDNITKPNRTLTLTLMDLPEQMTKSQNGCSEMGPIMPHSLIIYSRSGCPILVIWIFLFSPNWSQQCLLNVHSNWAQLHQIVSNEIGSIGVVLWSIEQLTTWTS